MQQANHAQNAQPAEASDRDTAEYVIPMSKGIEEPAIVGFARHRDGPADMKLHQINGDEQHVPENKITVDGVAVKAGKSGQKTTKSGLHQLVAKQPVEQN